MESALVRLLGLPRRIKQGVLMAIDLSCLPALVWLAMAVRYETLRPPLATHPLVFGLIGAGTVATLLLAGVYRTVVRAFDEKLLQDLVLAVALTVLALFVLAGLRVLPVPRTVPFIFGFFSFLWVWASRSAIRRGVRALARAKGPVTRVAIYGAGSAGRQLLSALRSAPEYRVSAFFDDAAELAGTTMQGLRVYHGSDFARMHALLHLDEVLIALPSLSRAERRKVVERIEPSEVRVRTLPGITELVRGEISIADIQDIDIGDLLGRDPVPPSPELISRDIQGKRVMVTGGGGSIGSELCRQVLAERPALLLVCEMSEYALYAIEHELQAIANGTPIIPVLGSVLDEGRLRRLMETYRIDTIYHAAAYKHVPLVEGNPFEGVINNAVGTLRAAKAALAARVQTFVLISTDKAVRPTNVMGASKRLAEMVLQGLAAEPGTKTRFCMVRFGNVLGSSGSVVPLFREQIAKGGPVTVTHPEVTRYFMTIPEAAQLVLQAGAMGAGGDLFVLDMGEPVRILELAHRMIRLSGLSVQKAGSENPGAIQIVYSGLRPGEKLYEELLIGNNVSGTEHPRILRAQEMLLPFTRVEQALAALQEMAVTYDVAGLKRQLAELVDGYTPHMSTSDSAESPCVSGAEAGASAAKQEEGLLLEWTHGLTEAQ